MLNSSSYNSIEGQVLQSNPILESFGNARTVRNDNSSRFGKLIEIQFERSGKIVGASIETYLLEKVRLVSQASGERNYHIFYQLFCERKLDDYCIPNTASPADFKITSSPTLTRRDGVSDMETYSQLKTAMEKIGFTEMEMRDVMSVTAAILHASNLTFEALPDDNSCLQDSVHLESVSRLLGVSPDDLNQALCYFSITAGNHVVQRALDKTKAEKGLEALLKTTYSALFEYLVERINYSIVYKDQKKLDEAGNEIPVDPASHPVATIGVLDIFGFESFLANSFEQLCINYCNEALQQQFNAYVLKNEQAEYERKALSGLLSSSPRIRMFWTFSRSGMVSFAFSTISVVRLGRPTRLLLSISTPSVSQARGSWPRESSRRVCSSL